MTVAVTGATGMVGRRLVAELLKQGHRVKVLTRDAAKGEAAFAGRAGVEVAGTGSWGAAIKAGCDAVVNLAGEPIAGRWTPEVKRELIASRVNATKMVVNAINAAEKKPAVLVNGSAVGFYGVSDTATFDEASPAGGDYLAEICTAWEAESRKVAEGVRLVNLRTGIVLDKEEGVLGKMLPVFQLFAGGPLGSGDQWVSWIHHRDLVGLILFALGNEAVEGPLNGTAPDPVTMNGLCKAMAKAVQRPSWAPVPDFVLQGLLGEGATLVLDGQKVLPKKAQELGYEFAYKGIEAAVRDAVKAEVETVNA